MAMATPTWRNSCDGDTTHGTTTHNDGDRETTCGATMVTTTPHMAQRWQL